MTVGALWEPLSLGRVRSITPALVPFLVAVAYYLGAEAAFGIGTLTQQFAPFWPPNVVLLCALLMAPKRLWPVLIAAVFPAHVLAEWGMAMPFPQVVAAFGCNVSVAVLNALALMRLVRGPPWLGSLRNASLYILLVVVAIPAVVALAAGFEPMLGDGDPNDYWAFWWRWYLSNALGGLTLTPVFLTVFGERWRDALAFPNRWRLFEALALTLCLVAACAVSFDTQLTRMTASWFPVMLYLPLPLVLAVAVRFGVKGASGAILVVTVMILFGAMHGHGPFVGDRPGQNVLSVQLFLAIIAIPTMLLAALVDELRRTNDRLSGVLDGISDCYYTLGRNGQITAVNANCAAWWGASTTAELIGKNYWQLRGGRREQAWVRRTIRTGVAARGEVHTADGRWVELHAYPTASGLSVFQHEITDRRAAELAARRTQELLQSSLDALTAQIAILDRTGKIIAANAAWHRAAEALSRADEWYLAGANFLEECERARPHQRTIAAGLRRLIRDEDGEFRFEYPSDFVEGAWFQLRGTCFGKGAELRLVVANVDISEVKASEGALRWLTGKLLRLQDEERRRIARELHDSTAQNLLAATLAIGQALRTTPRLKRTAKAALEESRVLIEETQRELRTVSYLLHPPMLDEAGLPPAMRWFCEGFAKRSDIAVELDIAPDVGRLPAEIEATLFRVAQEALTNVHRHSGGTRVRVSLMLGTPSETGPDVMLAVEDDGKGMPRSVLRPLEAPAGSGNVKMLGVGLAGMRERLHQFGGRLEIVTGPAGTTVRAVVPLSGDIPEQIDEPGQEQGGTLV
jgi:signal transduction histidine kinase